jgi:hypothetical protein
MSHNLMGDCHMDHMPDTLRCGHVRHHMLLDFWWKTRRNTGDGRNMTQEPGAQENCDRHFVSLAVVLGHT